MMAYLEEDYLLLSGIQHFAFCPRQWALIHVENCWSDNYFTATGNIMHKRAHDESNVEKRGDTIIFRAIKIASRQLGLSGECDVVEFIKDDNGVCLHNYEGAYLPFPIEYKRGKTKVGDCDRLQLCAQAICLEEMLGCEIRSGALFYGQVKHRENVEFTKELKEKVFAVARNMHDYYDKQRVPQIKKNKNCVNCSLKEECLPKLTGNAQKSVKQYLEDALL